MISLSPLSFSLFFSLSLSLALSIFIGVFLAVIFIYYISFCTKIICFIKKLGKNKKNNKKDRNFGSANQHRHSD